jgi:hypothetical protein
MKRKSWVCASGATKWRQQVVAGVSRRQPADPNPKNNFKAPKRRQQVCSFDVTVDCDESSLPPLRGSRFLLESIPWAYAHGYLLPSLRDSGSTQLENE